jgi:hypothetical protein
MDTVKGIIVGRIMSMTMVMKRISFIDSLTFDVFYERA